MNSKKSTNIKDRSKNSKIHPKSKVIVHERQTNDNLFKNDIKYQMNLFLNFVNPCDEENATKIITNRVKRSFRLIIPIIIVRYSLFSFNNFVEIVFSIVSILIQAFAYYVIIYGDNKDKLEKLPIKIDNYLISPNFLKILFEILIYIKLLFGGGQEEITILIICNCVAPSLFINILFDISLNHSLLFYILHFILILSINGDQNSYIHKRLFNNFFSDKIFIVLIIFLNGILLQYFLKKANRELWALYDSFKRSYFTLKKAIFDDFYFPVFIISKKCNNYIIYYKNTKADELIQKIKEIKNKDKSKFITNNSNKTGGVTKKIRIEKHYNSVNKDSYMEEIFLNKEIEDLFDFEINRCITNKMKYFDFQLNNVDGKNTNVNFKKFSNKFTFYEGDIENFEWYRIIVNPCIWKNQEAYYIQMIKHNDFYMNEMLSKCHSMISKDIVTTIENLDKTCDKLLEVELNNNQFKSSYSTSQVNYFKTSPDAINYNNELGNKSPKFSNLRKTTTVKNARNPSVLFLPNSTKTNAVKLSAPPVIQTNLPNYDYTIWLFLKYNLSFIYHNCLTLKILKSILNKRYHEPNSKIKIKDILNYYQDFFYVPSRIKNFRFIFLFPVNEAEIIIFYPYIGALIFNIMQFILNNSNDVSEEKLVEVTIEVNKDKLTQNPKINFKINYIDKKCKINFNQLKYILPSRAKGLINFQELMAKAKIVDIGILLVYYLLNQIYDNELVMETDTKKDEHKISFFITALDINKSNNCTNYSSFDFKEPNSRLFEHYYNKILLKIFNVGLPIENSKIIKNAIRKSSVMPTDSLKSNVSIKLKNDSLINEDDQIINSDETKNSIEEDKSFVNETNFVLCKHFNNYEKLISNEHNKLSIDLIIKKSLSIKISNTLKAFPEEYEKRILRLGDGIEKNQKYFNPPRFLIVEDNAFGRTNLIERLKYHKLNFLIDISAFGWESVQKYKSFLHKGYIYDIVFMDINLIDMKGSKAAEIMREIEKEYGSERTNIIAVSVEGHDKVMVENIFDGYIEKPIKSDDLWVSISDHFNNKRPEIKYLPKK